MAIVRRITEANIKEITTFGNLCDVIMEKIRCYSTEDSAIHIIMENYNELSIKSSERRRRAKTTKGKVCEVISEKQPLPDMDEFFTNISNKISLQNFFVDHNIATFKSATPLYIAGGSRDDPNKCIRIKNSVSKTKPNFCASHEEADDRIMFQIQKLYEKIIIAKLRLSLMIQIYLLFYFIISKIIGVT